MPGVCADDSMSYWIEALWVYLEQQLGDEIFVAAYRYLTLVSDNGDQDEEDLESIVPKDLFQFVPLIH